MSIHIGTSGWSYDHWHSVLYPHGIPPHERLDHYLWHYGTTELNSSYYRWPKEATFVSWKTRLPSGFVLSVKAPSLLTHVQRLYGPERWLIRIAGSLRRLGDRFGVLLVQLSPKMEFDYDRLAYFLAQVPWGLRVTVEFRHPSWHQEATFQLLERHNAAYCIMSGAHLPCILRATASFVAVARPGSARFVRGFLLGR